jgi:hypothetical protein
VFRPEGGEKYRIMRQQTALVGCCWLCCWAWKSLELPYWAQKVDRVRILATRGEVFSAPAYASGRFGVGQNEYFKTHNYILL